MCVCVCVRARACVHFCVRVYPALAFAGRRFPSLLCRVQPAHLARSDKESNHDTIMDIDPDDDDNIDADDDDMLTMVMAVITEPTQTLPARASDAGPALARPSVPIQRAGLS